VDGGVVEAGVAECLDVVGLDLSRLAGQSFRVLEQGAQARVRSGLAALGGDVGRKARGATGGFRRGLFTCIVPAGLR